MERCRAGAGAGNKCKKEKREQTFHICSSNASKGNLYLRINTWATFYYLHPCNLANSKRAMHLLEGKKWPFGVENPFFPPVICLLSSAITHRASSPCDLHISCWSPWLSVYHTNTEVVLPGLQEQVLLFSQSMAVGSVGATQDFHYFQKECFV